MNTPIQRGKVIDEMQKIFISLAEFDSITDNDDQERLTYIKYATFMPQYVMFKDDKYVYNTEYEFYDVDKLPCVMMLALYVDMERLLANVMFTKLTYSDMSKSRFTLEQFLLSKYYTE